MTGRICILGNSHTACLKLAEDEGRPAGLPPTDWFAASANRVGGLRCEDGRALVAEDPATSAQFAAVSGGRTRIELADYDAFALVGVCFQPRDFLRFFRRHCLWRHRDWGAGRALVADDTFRAFLANLHRWRPAYRLAREIAAARPDAPLLLVSAPWPSPQLLEEQGQRHLRPLRGTPYFAELDRLRRAAAEAAAAAVGARAVFQDPATFDRAGFTDRRFSEGPIGLRAARKLTPGVWLGRKKAEDPWHMNPAFGRIRLENIAAALAA